MCNVKVSAKEVFVLGRFFESRMQGRDLPRRVLWKMPSASVVHCSVHAHVHVYVYACGMRMKPEEQSKCWGSHLGPIFGLGGIPAGVLKLAPTRCSHFCI